MQTSGMSAHGQLHGVDQVVAGVAAQLAQRLLRAGQDDGDGDVVQHVGEGRGRVGQRVGAVGDDHAVDAADAGLDDGGQLLPVLEIQFGAVENEGDLHLDVGDGRKLGDDLEQAGVELVGAQHAAAAVAGHADGAAGMDEQDLFFHGFRYMAWL